MSRPTARLRALGLHARTVSGVECTVPGNALEPCPRCGGTQVWVTSHSQCVRCRWVTPCCEGAPLPERVPGLA